MNEISTVVDQYIAAWNEKDAERRAALIAESCAGSASYVDPMMQAEGREGILGLIQGVQQQFPTHGLRRTGGIEVVKDRIRFTWDLSGPDGTVMVAGTDFIVLSEDGKLETITGFFDQAPAV